MSIDKKRAFNYLKEFEFERLAGSADELRAANLIKREIEAAGGNCDLVPFEITDGEIEVAEFEILEPYKKTYEVTGYKCCLNTDEDGLTADFLYVENVNEVNLCDAKGKIVLLNGYLRLPTYKMLIEAGVAAIVSFSGSLKENRQESDFFTRTLREQVLKFGNMPAVHMLIHDAFDIVKNNATKARIKVKGKTTHPTSHNVISTIKGTAKPDEVICIGAHYDSTEFSKGVFDNAAGSVIIMEMYKHFMENPPKRTLKFAWFGSEEIGLCGSKAYVKANEEELKDHIFMINVDVGAAVLGANVCSVTASKELTAFCDMYMKTKGYAIEVKQDVYSSDSIPFADNGIPGINFMRFGTPGSTFIHTSHDTMEYLSEEGLHALTAPVLEFSELIINSAVFPQKREVPKEIEEKLEKYLFKKELKELEEKEKKEEKNKEEKHLKYK